MILVNQQNFTTNLITELLTHITELLTYMASGLQEMAVWAKALKLNQKVLCPLSALPGLGTQPFHNAPGEHQVQN